MQKHDPAREALAVVTATASAAVLYLIARHGLGIEPESPTLDEERVSVWSVLTASGAAASLGWGLLGILRHRSSHAMALWTRIAVVVTVVSLLGPLTTPGLTPGGRVLLSVLHLVVGGVTIGLLRSAGESAGRPVEVGPTSAT